VREDDWKLFLGRYMRDSIIVLDEMREIVRTKIRKEKLDQQAIAHPFGAM